jgi:hypothetical protein
MDQQSNLTYYEYWLTKNCWSVEHAIYLLSSHIRLVRGWNAAEDSFDIARLFQNKIKKEMLDRDADHIFKKKVWSEGHYDEQTHVYVEPKINVVQSDVDPKKFIEWAYAKGYKLPHEFKEFIGVEEQDPRRSQRDEYALDKAVCQAVAKTLWDEYPKMTIDEMQDHKAIQLYAGGKGYSTDTTLRRWLRVVDPRCQKTGPKKKAGIA